MNRSVLVVNATHASGGGIVNAAMAQAAALATRGWRVTLVTGMGMDERAYLEDAGVSVLVDPPMAAPGSALLRGRWLRYRRIMTELSVDAVIHQGAKSYFTFQAMRRMPPHLVVFHNARIGGRARFREWIALTPKMHERLTEVAKGYGPVRRVHLVENAYLPWRKVSTGRSAGNAEGELTIGCLSVLTRRKAVDLILKAVAQRVRAGQPMRVVVAGDGEERPALERLAADLGIGPRVAFWGWTNDLVAFFAAIDVFCLSSYAEPFGIAVLEAMANGCPVVATDTEGPATIIDDRVDGRLVPEGDVAQLAAAFAELAASGAVRRRYAAAGLEKVERRFNVETLGRRLEAVIEGAVARARDGGGR